MSAVAIREDVQLESVEVVEIVQANTLDELAELIETQINCSSFALRVSIEHAIAAGKYLLAAKELVERGKWKAWLAERFGASRVWSLNMYMRVAAYEDEVRANGYIDLAQAHAALRGRAPSNHSRFRSSIRTLDRDELKNLKNQGASYRQLEEQFGVSKSAMWKLLNPERSKNLMRARKAKYRAAERALRREQDASVVKKAGGRISEAYSLLRRALQELDAAVPEATDIDVRRGLNGAIRDMHSAEDKIAQAVRLS